VVRSNVAELSAMCTEIAPRFRELRFVRFGVLIPTGLGSRADYVEREMLDEAEVAALFARLEAMRAAAPPGVEVDISDGLFFQMKSEQVARGAAANALVKIEADGRLRAMDIYEGTVGSLLDEPFDVLWRRAEERLRDPFVVETLARVRTRRDWAAACRAIDERFAARDDLVRIRARPVHGA
jgi:hypothetical protein